MNITKKDRALAEEIFRLRGEQKRAGRGYVGRRMHRSNLGVRMKAEASRPVEALQEWLSALRKRKPRYNAIPAPLRPDVPKNRRLIATGDWQQVSQYAKELRAVCTPRQWQHIEALYFGRLAG